MTLATTGLDPAKGDEILGISFHIYEPDGKDTECPKILRLCTVEGLQKSMEFHQVSQQMMVREGYEDKQWKDRLMVSIGEQPVTWLTYNPEFANAFFMAGGIPIRVHNFAQLLMFANSRMPFKDFRTLEGLDQAMAKERKAPGIRTLAKYAGVSCEPFPGELPMQAMLRVICHMAQELFAQDCLVMQE